MIGPLAPLLDRIRKPAYTGENRCTPCTVLNVAIALVASGLVAIVSPALAVATLLVSLLSITLRGYLVPGTPHLTKRYLPDRVLASFDTHPVEGTRTDEKWETVGKREDQRENAVDPERFLLDVGAVEPCEDEDDLCLTDGFARLIDRRRGTRDDAVDRGAMAGLFDADPGSVAVLDREYPAVEIDRRVRKWPSEAAWLADVLTDDALRELTERWVEVPLEQRLGILQSLRSFRTTCPRCSGEVVLSEDTVESCCRSYEVLTFGCAGCGQPLLEFTPEEIEMQGNETGVRP